MLRLLLWYSKNGALPLETALLQRPIKMTLKHGILSVELGIKFTPDVYELISGEMHREHELDSLCLDQT